MSKAELVAFKDAVMALLKLCKERHTGAMYMFTDQGHGAIVSISAGNITDVFFRNVRGEKAIDELNQIQRTKFFFKGDTGGAAGAAKQMPAGSLSNEEIFSRLGVDYQVDGGVGLQKILVVEDSGLARKVLVEALSGQGYYVIEAKDGEEAIEQLGCTKPDLVLLDLILPKKDGYEVLASMKKDPLLKDIPVIVLTSRDTLFDKLKGRMSGTDEYMTKPVNPDVLKEKLKKYLG